MHKYLLPILLLILSCEEVLESVTEGCTTTTACNYNATATKDDGSCVAPEGCNEWCAGGTDTTSVALELDCIGVCGGNAIIDVCGVCDNNPDNDCDMDCSDVDNPNISLIYPTSGLTLEEEINISVAASSNIAIDRVEFYIGGLLAYTDTLSNYEYQWDTRDFDNGSLPISVIVYDDCGQFSSVNPISVTIDNDVSNPSVSINSPSSGETVGGTYTISANVSDDRELDSLYFYINDIPVDTLYEEPYSYLWDTTLESEDENYIISAKAIDEAGNSGTATPITVYVNNIPEKPEVSVSVSENSESISITWTSISIASKYKIYRAGEFVNETSSTNWSETLVPYTEYCYQVSAISNLDVEGELSDSKCGTTGNTPLNPPSMNLTSDYHEISITWSNIEGAASYNIFLTNPASGLLANTTDLFYVDTGLAYDTYRCYKISVTDSWEDEGGQSSQYCQSTYSEPSPEPPTNVNISVSGDYLQLTWTLSISNNADTYIIYKNNTQVSEVGNDVTTYNDGDYQYDNYYTYYVQVKSESGLTNQSEQVSITAPNNPNYYDIQFINNAKKWNGGSCDYNDNYSSISFQLYQNDSGGTQIASGGVGAGATSTFYDVVFGESVSAYISITMYSGNDIATGNFTFNNNKVITVSGTGNVEYQVYCGDLTYTVTNP